ncbi:MAG: TIGR00730 family Rossman fold protein [Mogibacterium sp.]|nr:TIGR00730 family Rossman fold protein [Mogibacterium sp.]MBQ6502023.1 TIGR00730 family Rossman fold protein [Mogibacterium sp.]
MNITVYCGAAEGMDPEYIERARELGAWMASKGHTLVYGAGNSGMMGAVSDALIEGGGEAIGVTPRFFILAEETRDDLAEVVISDDMSTRRSWMIENGDAFIALPGGMGTLDEITEVMTYKRLGLLGKVNKPVMIYNVNGYYDRFFSFLDDMNEQDFCRQLDRDNVIEVKCLEDIVRALETVGSIDETRTSKYD